MANISVCITIKNDSAADIIKNLEKQTVLPDEAVIVDAGEGDRHGSLSLRTKIKINYIQKECNRSEGRNLAAKNALHENLVFLDAGCVPNKNWLEEMNKAISARGAEIIAGNYQSKKKNFKDYLIARFLNRAISEDNFIYPSARNFAIKKSIFLRLKGFREKLTTAEDLEFFKRSADRGFKIEKAEKAIVWWKLPNLREYFKKLFSYAKGDAESGIWWDSRKKLQTHNIKHLLTLARYAVLIVIATTRFFWLIPFFLTVYLSAVAVRQKIDFRKFGGGNILFIADNMLIFVYIKVLTDVCTMAGFIYGFVGTGLPACPHAQAPRGRPLQKYEN